MDEKGVSTVNQKEAKDQKVMHDFDAQKTSSLFSMKLIIVLIVVALLGVGTGYMLAGSGSGGKGIAAKLTGSDAVKGKTYGDGDIKVFKDTAEGEVKEGGIEGEGQFHLVRPGGDDQNVYMTSSSVDLSQFVGKKVKVWGQTFQGQKAGWLMDVGRLQVLN